MDTATVFYFLGVVFLIGVVVGLLIAGSILIDRD